MLNSWRGPLSFAIKNQISCEKRDLFYNIMFVAFLCTTAALWSALNDVCTSCQMSSNRTRAMFWCWLGIKAKRGAIKEETGRSRQGLGPSVCRTGAWIYVYDVSCNLRFHWGDSRMSWRPPGFTGIGELINPVMMLDMQPKGQENGVCHLSVRVASWETS